MYRCQRFVYGLGALFVAVALGQVAVGIVRGDALLDVVVDFAFLTLAGGLLLSVGRWLSEVELEADRLFRIGAWSLVGVAVVLSFLALRALDPDVETALSLGTRATALASGAVAGTAVGIHEARAISRARELEERNDELRRTQRTLELRNEELERTRVDLEHAVERLEASNERLDHFAGVASHDLREPLRMVSSYLQLLERRHGDDLDEDGAEFVAIAVDATARMRTLLTDLLEYSRAESRGEWYEPVDLAGVLEDVQTDLQVRIEEREAEVTVDALPRVRGDRSQLRQVLQNLVANAIDYSEGPPRIEVFAEPRDEEWIVSVRDEGTGIDADDQERIFEAFQSLHPRADAHGSADESSAGCGGSGIGLALCRRVVEHHGGRIWVDSEPGAGSTFSFALPRVADTGSVRPGDAVDAAGAASDARSDSAAGTGSTTEPDAKTDPNRPRGDRTSA